MSKEYRSSSPTQFKTRIEPVHTSDMTRRRIRTSGRAALRNLRLLKRKMSRSQLRGQAWRNRPKAGSKQLKMKSEGRMI
jgi:hypothetical protein